MNSWYRRASHPSFSNIIISHSISYIKLLVPSASSIKNDRTLELCTAAGQRKVALSGMIAGD